MKPSALLLLKTNHEYNDRVTNLARTVFSSLTLLETDRLTPFSEEIFQWNGDYLISYLCQRVVSGIVLRRATTAAINFHPGPPEYPGIGCTNFALYHGVSDFGVTCHFMHECVDSGSIIEVRRFPIEPSDSVFSLTQRCYSHLADLYGSVLEKIDRNEPIHPSSEKWTRTPYRRSELDELCRITKDMPDEEVQNRIRATHFPGKSGPYIDVAGARFFFKKAT